ncbi:MAG: hypothetical protein DI565_00530 [Ancylobacter novellus]|uniref:Uncharacterized protein n=1 Tax=Ancylobacter novellus TaxID=921 RepID=A0A2W5KPD3_ANCNO|nr:MAG: hypothetical protein DI565_00530 [Ancylobacter novellus]
MSGKREKEIARLRSEADAADVASTFATCAAQAADCDRRAFRLRAQAEALERIAAPAETADVIAHAPGCAALDPAAEPQVCDCGGAKR